jgi:hypothetical protein
MDIKEIIIKQLDYNRHKNILYKNPQDILSIDQDFLTALKEYQASDITEDLITYASDEMIKAVYSINQFINVQEDKKEELKEIYRQSWRFISGGMDVKDCLFKKHYPAISLWLSSLYPPLIKEYLKEQKETGSIICEEYTPEFQLQILGINISSLMQPVLDIGCGKNASLVKFLRENGIEAFGFDRLIETETEYLGKSDWLNYNYKIKKWGTIISNAAFSNHVMYTARYEPGKLKSYLLIYNEIINSLKPGGEFIYAPGLPFIEEHLDREKYFIKDFNITGEYKGTIVKTFPSEY